MTAAADIHRRAQRWLANRPLITVGECTEYFQDMPRWPEQVPHLNIRAADGRTGKIISNGKFMPTETERYTDQIYVGIDLYRLLALDWQEALTSSAVTDRVNRFDEDASAVVLMQKNILGYRVGDRFADIYTPARVRDAGRKTDRHSLISKAGLPLVPSQIVNAGDAAEVMRTWRIMSSDGRLPTVWSGDLYGHSADGSDTVLVGDELVAIEWCADFHERVDENCRIAAYRDGVPFEVTFYVAEDGEVFVLPPVEQIVFQSNERFYPVGHSSFLEIDKLRMDAIVSYAFEMGKYLRDTVGFKSFGSLGGFIGLRTDFSDLDTYPGDSLKLHSRASGQPLWLLHLLTESGQSQGINVREAFDQVWRAHARNPLAMVTDEGNEIDHMQPLLTPDANGYTPETEVLDRSVTLVSRQRPRSRNSLATREMLGHMSRYLAENREPNLYDGIPMTERADRQAMPGLANSWLEL